MNGSKNATIKVIAKERNTTGKIRSGVVSVKASDGTTKSVTIEQSRFFAEGDGSVQNPYKITNADDLFCLKYAIGMGLNISIENDINVSSILPDDGWKSVEEFRGVLNGNNHNILGLWGAPFIDKNYGTISGINLILDSKGISGSGAICSYLYSGGTIENCIVKGNVIGLSEYTGGICGISGGGTIRRCSMSGKVSNGRYVGGIVGYGSGDIKECFSEGNVIGSYYVSGINNGTISVSVSDSYSNATVELTAVNGEVAGISTQSKCFNCYYSGKIIGNSNKFGVSGVLSSHSYYNSETSGASQGGIPKISIDMKKQATYEGWDFNTIWKIDEGKSYPQLRCFDK